MEDCAKEVGEALANKQFKMAEEVLKFWSTMNPEAMPHQIMALAQQSATRTTEVEGCIVLPLTMKERVTGLVKTFYDPRGNGFSVEIQPNCFAEQLQVKIQSVKNGDDGPVDTTILLKDSWLPVDEMNGNNEKYVRIAHTPNLMLELRLHVVEALLGGKCTIHHPTQGPLTLCWVQPLCHDKLYILPFGLIPKESSLLITVRFIMPSTPLQDGPLVEQLYRYYANEVRAPQPFADTVYLEEANGEDVVKACKKPNRMKTYLNNTGQKITNLLNRFK